LCFFGLSFLAVGDMGNHIPAADKAGHAQGARVTLAAPVNLTGLRLGLGVLFIGLSSF